MLDSIRLTRCVIETRMKLGERMGESVNEIGIGMWFQSSRRTLSHGRSSTAVIATLSMCPRWCHRPCCPRARCLWWLYPDSRLGQIRPYGDFLSRGHVRITIASENCLQFLQLKRKREILRIVVRMHRPTLWMLRIRRPCDLGQKSSDIEPDKPDVATTFVYGLG